VRCRGNYVSGTPAIARVRSPGSGYRLPMRTRKNDAAAPRCFCQSACAVWRSVMPVVQSIVPARVGAASVKPYENTRVYGGNGASSGYACVPNRDGRLHDADRCCASCPR